MKVWYILGGALVLIILFALFNFPGKAYIGQFVFKDQIKALQDEVTRSKETITQYEDTISTMQKEKEILQKGITDRNKTIAELKKKGADVKPPTTNKEIRSRFESLGYKPVN
jgi:peptidoglycan hydrolase CwlO-like protein